MSVRSFAKAWLVVLLLLVTTATTIVAQQSQPEQAVPPRAEASAEARVLELEKPIERELAGGQAHTYQITLAAGQYLHLVTEQRGIDVVVTLYGPDDKRLIEMDTPNGAQGPESVKWVTESGGDYRLEIRLRYQVAKTGRYEVKMTELRAATDADRPLVEAFRLANESERLRAKRLFAEALPLAEQSLKLREAALGPNHLEVARSLRILALLYDDKGEYAKAEPLYQRALAIREKILGPEHLDVALSLRNLASHYDDKGEYAKALPLSQRALVISEKILGPEHPGVAEELNMLSLLYYSMGDYAKAELLSRRALKIKELVYGPKHPDVAMVLTNLANLHDAKGEYGKAEPLYQRVLAIYEQMYVSPHPDVADALDNLADHSREQGNYAKAEPLLQRALMIREQSLGATHPDVAISLYNLAELYRTQSDYAKAEPLYQRALAIWEQRLGPNHPDVADALNHLTLLYRENGEVSSAIQFAARTAENREFNFNQNLVAGSERQKLLYLALCESETNLILSLHAQTAPHNVQALQLAFTTLLRRKGRGLEAASEAIAALRRRASPQDQPLFDQLAHVRSQLASLTLAGARNTAPDQYRAELQQLAEDADKLEADLSARSAEFHLQTQFVTIAAIQAALPAGTALIEFAIYRTFDAKAQKDGPLHYVAYTLTAQGEPHWVELGKATRIERLIHAWRQSLRTPQRQDVKGLGRKLDALVMQPVRSLVGGAKHLLISPDGMLNLIPFAALVDDQNHYLTERYECSYLTSGRDLLRLQVPRASRSDALIVANPAFGKRPLSEIVARRKVEIPSSDTFNPTPTIDFSQAYFNPLPGTASEAQTLHALLPQATVLTQAQATKLALQEVRSPRLLHIATHGFFLRDAAATAASARSIRLPRESGGMEQSSGPLIDPLIRSGLALAGANRHQAGTDNGILTAKEAAGLNLWGTKLVVLSACDTGVGEVKNGEGVYGLRRAFVLAGAETQVMSLWPVSDQGTRELMIDYYKGVQRGEGRSAALRKVQLRMLKNPARRHPYYWASFIPSGEWANLDGQR